MYKIEAQGDTVYVKAPNQEAAVQRLRETMGDIPRSLLKVTEIDSLPDGEEWL